MGVTPDLAIEIASRHAVYLEGAKTGYVNEFDKFLRAMQRDVLEQINRIDNPASLSKKRLKEILRAVNESLRVGVSNYESVWRAQLAELGEYSAEFELRAMGKVVRADFILPTPNQLANAAFSTPLSATGVYEGMLLDSFFKDVMGKTAQRVAGAVRLTAAQGGTTQDLVRKIQGNPVWKTRNGKRVKEYIGGLMNNLTRLDARAIARTSLAHVANTSKMTVWEANSDIVEQWEFLATLDSRTTEPCRSLSGRRFNVGEGPMPILHINCRSGMVGVYNDGLDFLDKAGTQFSRGESGISRVSPDLSYYDWLKTQSSSFQDSVIGPERGKLLRNGGLSSTRFAKLQLNKEFQPITLDQMRKLEPIAFESAGI